MKFEGRKYHDHCYAKLPALFEIGDGRSFNVPFWVIKSIRFVHDDAGLDDIAILSGCTSHSFSRLPQQLIIWGKIMNFLSQPI